jgi:L-ascorbate metabolism protein UlaG (beta-lactamase superfamily)
MRWKTWLAISAGAIGAAVAWKKWMRYAGSTRSYRLNIPGGDEGANFETGSVMFIGTATTLIRYGGLTILTDPNFLHQGEHVHIGYGMHAMRLTDPAMEFEDLPPFDFVLLSHMHEDHFDKLVQQRLPKDTPILTTASAARTLRRLGFTRLCGLRRWDSVLVTKGSTSLRITSMPGTHGPLLVSAFLPDVMGSMLEFRSQTDGRQYRIYVSGDTLMFRDLTEIPLRYPRIDLGLFHLGGTRVLGVLVTMDDKQGIQAVRLIDPDIAIPIHFDDYDVFKSPLEDFMRAVERAGLQHKVRYLPRGNAYHFSPRGVEEPATRDSGD